MLIKIMFFPLCFISFEYQPIACSLFVTDFQVYQYCDFYTLWCHCHCLGR